jgi:hypothetical protein
MFPKIPGGDANAHNRVAQYTIAQNAMAVESCQGIG